MHTAFGMTSRCLLLAPRQHRIWVLRSAIVERVAPLPQRCRHALVLGNGILCIFRLEVRSQNCRYIALPLMSFIRIPARNATTMI